MYICESWWDHFSDVTLVNDDWWYLLNILLIWQADTEDNEDHEDHDDHNYYNEPSGEVDAIAMGPICGAAAGDVEHARDAPGLVVVVHHLPQF